MTQALTAEGYPVIPTVDRARDLHRLPEARRYVVKPKRGADSLGLRIVTVEDLNPYLSLDALDAGGRDAFVDATTRSPHRFLTG